MDEFVNSSNPILPRTIPDRSEWRSLQPALTIGELELAELLDDTLPDGWVIAVQVQLWSWKVGVVAYNPDAGLSVFEVEDWDPADREFHYSSRTEALMSRSGSSESWYVARNPVGQVMSSRDAFQSVYYGDEPARRHLTSTVLMTNISEGDQLIPDLKRLLTTEDQRHRETFRVLGCETLEQGITHDLIPVAFDLSLQEPLKERTKKRIEEILNGQLYLHQNLEPLGLDKRKRELLIDPPSRRRVCGPAGSGKSVLIAAAAADAAIKGQSVLVLGFNITQTHYLRHLAARYKPDGTDANEVNKAVRNNVNFFYLHEWCESVCRETGYEKQFRNLIYKYVQRNDYPTQEIKSLLSEALKTREWSSERQTRVNTYDRILIDEAQNIDAEWFALIEQLLESDDSDLMIAYDPTQNLYELGTSSWTDTAMTGFPGRPVKLEYSYRLPSSTIPMLKDYCETFLDGENDIEIPISDPQAEFISCRLLYRNTFGSESLSVAVGELVNFFSQERHLGDIAFILGGHSEGMETLNYLRERGSDCVEAITSVFGTNQQMKQRNKKSFMPSVGEIKGSTIHSFQGWEAPCVIFGIPEFGVFDTDDLSDFQKHYWKIVYTGLTRVMNSNLGSELVILNEEPLLEDFFAKHFELI